MKWDFILAIISTSYVLHNVLVMSKDWSMNEILRDLDLDENRLPINLWGQRMQ